MKWAIYTWLVLNLLGLGVNLAKHGEPREINFWSELIGFILSIGLLWIGGLFDNL